MNDVDPQTWLADVPARLPDYPANKVADLLPWNWDPLPGSRFRLRWDPPQMPGSIHIGPAWAYGGP
jgi:hypothetical protein